MVRQVFEPLAMERTAVAETEGLDGVAHQGRRPDYSCVAGAGAFLSTPTDLVRLGSAMLKPGARQEYFQQLATRARHGARSQPATRNRWNRQKT
jgi:CubicO group peptidase (beta-lactamase class C family)